MCGVWRVGCGLAWALSSSAVCVYESNLQPQVDDVLLKGPGHFGNALGFCFYGIICPSAVCLLVLA
jgi:hypothetical protein